MFYVITVNLTLDPESRGHAEVIRNKCWWCSKCQYVYFDLTCDVIGDLEVNKIKLRLTILAGLSNAVGSSKIGPVVLKIGGELILAPQWGTLYIYPSEARVKHMVTFNQTGLQNHSVGCNKQTLSSTSNTCYGIKPICSVCFIIYYFILHGTTFNVRWPQEMCYTVNVMHHSMP